jgi:polar amino acid transport system substrate-binding protein
MKRFVTALYAILIAVILFSCTTTKSIDSSSSSLSDIIKVLVATDATFPPMESVNENKQLVGFDIDVMKAIASAAGFQVVFINTEWGSIFTGLNAGKYDAVISSVTITETRKKILGFSEPYLNAGQVILVPINSEHINQLSDLAGLSVGTQVGTAGAELIQKDNVYLINGKIYEDIRNAIIDLNEGRLSAIIIDYPVAAYYRLWDNTYKGKFKTVEKVIQNEFYGIVVRKDNEKLNTLINQGLEKIIASGDLKKIESNWLQ